MNPMTAHAKGARPSPGHPGPGTLLLVVGALVAAVIAMHSLGFGHSTMATPMSGSTASSLSTTLAMRTGTMHTPATPTGIGAAAVAPTRACSPAGCAHATGRGDAMSDAMGSMCLAVLSALLALTLLLRLNNRATQRAAHALDAAARALQRTQAGPACRPPRPLFRVLCVLRT